MCLCKTISESRIQIVTSHQFLFAFFFHGPNDCQFCCINMHIEFCHLYVNLIHIFIGPQSGLLCGAKLCHFMLSFFVICNILGPTTSLDVDPKSAFHGFLYLLTYELFHRFLFQLLKMRQYFVVYPKHRMIMLGR